MLSLHVQIGRVVKARLLPTQKAVEHFDKSHLQMLLPDRVEAVRRRILVKSLHL